MSLVALPFRAVLGWNNAATAATLANGTGIKTGWSAAQVGESFRQALCSLANALVHSEAERVTAASLPKLVPAPDSLLARAQARATAQAPERA